MLEGIKQLYLDAKNISAKMKDAKIIINNDDAGNLQLKGDNFITFGLIEADYLAKNINYNAISKPS